MGHTINSFVFPFSRRFGGGSGLGLSICQSNVKNHGGTIDIQSERGRGTCVTIWLPYS
ncbi:ATP-binding protein [Desulfosporosinus fructosivorans]